VVDLWNWRMPRNQRLETDAHTGRRTYIAAYNRLQLSRQQPLGRALEES
jgi:hypothetical protein